MIQGLIPDRIDILHERSKKRNKSDRGCTCVFPPVGLCLPFLTFVHGDGVTTAGGVCGPPHCVLLLHRLALTPFVEQFCQSGGSCDRRFNRILHTWNSFSTHLRETLKLTKCIDKQYFWTYKRDMRHVTINRNAKSNIKF